MGVTFLYTSFVNRSNKYLLNCIDSSCLLAISNWNWISKIIINKNEYSEYEKLGKQSRATFGPSFCIRRFVMYHQSCLQSFGIQSWYLCTVAYTLVTKPRRYPGQEIYQTARYRITKENKKDSLIIETKQNIQSHPTSSSSSCVYVSIHCFQFILVSIYRIVKPYKW